MSRIIGVTFLLIILVDNFSSTASHAGLHVSKVHIRKCRCRVSTNGTIECRSPLFPTNHKEKRNPMKCLCSKTNQHKFPALKAACTTRRHEIPIPMI